MGEIVPVFLGFVVGLIGSRIPVPRMRYIVMTVLAIICGVASTILVGEAEESWAFALVDVFLVAFVAAITYGLAHLVTRRLTQPR
jgi:hypothetical protein